MTSDYCYPDAGLAHEHDNTGTGIMVIRKCGGGNSPVSRDDKVAESDQNSDDCYNLCRVLLVNSVRIKRPVPSHYPAVSGLVDRELLHKSPFREPSCPARSSANSLATLCRKVTAFS